MAATIDATVGGASSNSYITLADAQAYFDERFGAGSWDGETEDNQNRSLIQATRTLDANYSWQGYKADDDQALDWPRTEAYDCDDDSGDPLPSDEIPDAIKWATCELAMYILSGTQVSSMANVQKGIKKASVAELSVEFSTSYVAGRIPYEAINFIGCLGYRKSGGSHGRLIKY